MKNRLRRSGSAQAAAGGGESGLQQVPHTGSASKVKTPLPASHLSAYWSACLPARPPAWDAPPPLFPAPAPLSISVGLCLLELRSGRHAHILAANLE